jgi:hypothetical protein
MMLKLQQWMPAVWTTLCFLGILQVIDYEIETFNANPTLPIDPRYAVFKKFIPQQQAGYLVDAPPDSELGSLGFARAQYALVPHVLVTNKTPEYVIVDLQNPQQRDSFLIFHSLDPFVTSDIGVCLAKRHPPLK